MSVSIRKESVFQFVNNLVADLVTPVSISYLWNWGSLLVVFLVGQIITGIFLAMFYCPHETLGFHLVAELGLNINSACFVSLYLSFMAELSPFKLILGYKNKVPQL